MCPPGARDFVRRQISADDVNNRIVLELGSGDPECWVRNLVTSLRPRAYVGVDLVPGPGVDLVCPAEQLLDHFAPESSDVVISTEVLEHVRDWRTTVYNLKTVLGEDGILILTTRSPGFEFHGFPLDFWRFTPEDIREIFGDLTIEQIEQDFEDPPGVFLRARRPRGFVARNLDSYRIYSVIRRRRAKTLTRLDVGGAHGLLIGQGVVNHVLPRPVRTAIRRTMNRSSRLRLRRADRYAAR